MSFLELAAFVDEEPAVDGAVEERYPVAIVEGDDAREVGIAGNDPAHPAGALFGHERAHAAVDGLEFLERPEADAVFGIEEDGAFAAFGDGGFAKVARLKLDERGDRRVDGVGVGVFDGLGGDVGSDDGR